MTRDIQENHEQGIRQLIADQQRAMIAKDVDGIMAHYAADAVIFNVKPPFQIRNGDQWRQVWESSLAHFPASFGVETRDLMMHVNPDLAVAHYFSQFTGIGQDDSWIRNTAAYRRDRGKWLIVHEHSSVPFDPETMKPVFGLK